MLLYRASVWGVRDSQASRKALLRFISTRDQPAPNRRLSFPSHLRHDVATTPATAPTGAARLYRRPPTRLNRRSSQLLPHLEIVDPAYSKSHFRLCQVLQGEPRIMGEHVSGSFYLPCQLHQIPAHLLRYGCHRWECGRGRMDFIIFQRRALRHHGARTLILAGLTPRVFTRVKIPQSLSLLYLALTDPQSHLFVPSPGGCHRREFWGSLKRRWL